MAQQTYLRNDNFIFLDKKKKSRTFVNPNWEKNKQSLLFFCKLLIINDMSPVQKKHIFLNGSFFV